MLRRGQGGGRATGPQDIGVETGVVCRNKLGAIEKPPELRPDIPESLRVGHLRPGDAMDVAEDKGFAWRADQPVFPVDNGVVLDPDHGEGTGAILSVVGSLKVQRHKTIRLQFWLSP